MIDELKIAITKFVYIETIFPTGLVLDWQYKVIVKTWISPKSIGAGQWGNKNNGGEEAYRSLLYDDYIPD